MTTTSRRVGPYEITILNDGLFKAPKSLMLHNGSEAARAELLARLPDELALPVNMFLLRAGNEPILVDAAMGSAAGQAFGQARRQLAELKVRPQDVRRVLLTHIHSDHVLGLFEGDEPYFPEAEIIVPPVDLDHFTSPAARAAAPAERQGPFDLAERLKAIYGTRLYTFMDRRLPEGIEPVALPGHTPGHSGFRIRGEAQDLLLFADLVHLAEHQPGDPDIAIAFDVDPRAAAVTRAAALAEAAVTNTLVAGAHVEGFNEVVRHGGALAMRRA